MVFFVMIACSQKVVTYILEEPEDGVSHGQDYMVSQTKRPQS
jgi:hypothetical protein